MINENEIKEIKEFLTNIPANDYWKFVGKEKVPTDEMVISYINKFSKTDFISKTCAKERKCVRTCLNCFHFYECLEIEKPYTEKEFFGDNKYE